MSELSERRAESCRSRPCFPNRDWLRIERACRPLDLKKLTPRQLQNVLVQNLGANYPPLAEQIAGLHELGRARLYKLLIAQRGS